jgi:hypothetical protein
VRPTIQGANEILSSVERIVSGYGRPRNVLSAVVGSPDDPEVRATDESSWRQFLPVQKLVVLLA